jgi:DNA polymerase
MFDFETRSELNLKDVGAWVYSKHPSTEVLMVTWQFQDSDTIHIWRYHDNPAKVQPLLDVAVDPDLMLNTFNGFFEYCIWQHCCHRKLGWPKLPGVTKLLDVQDKAKAMALPANLEELGVVTKAAAKKDKEGKRLIQKFSTPRRGKAGGFNDPLAPENRDDWAAFCRYGIADTKAQTYQDRTLPDLMPKEQIMAWLTNEMNERGVHINLPACRRAERLALRLKEIYNKRASDLSGGLFEKCTQRATVKDWLQSNGLTLPNMQGDTIKTALRELKLTVKQRRMLEYYQIAGSTSVAKFTKMLEQCDPETGRVHELLSYHRAKTGRYGGLGIQIQNLPRPVMPKSVDPLKLVEFVQRCSIAQLERFAKKHKVTPMQVLLSVIRTLITPLVGDKFKVGDYAQIEARLVLWAAQDEVAIEIFKRGEDIYLFTASGLYNIPYEQLNKESPQRPMAKAVTLGATYNMGWKRLMGYVEDYGLSLDAQEAKRTITKFRQTYDKLPVLWDWLDRSAVAALLRYHGKRVPKDYLTTHRKFDHLRELPLTFFCEQHGNVLYLVMQFPNTKKVYYPHAKIVKGKFGGYAVGCEGARTDAGSGGWGRLDYYGGKFCENFIQGIARELLAAGGLLLRAADYSLVLSVHDEWVSEDDERFGSEEEFKALCGYLPAWARTLPMDVDYYESDYYRK